MNYTFQWTDENGVGKRMNVLTSDENFAWFKALQSCGWDNRTTLGIVGDCKSRQIRNGIIKNWFDAVDNPNLKTFNLSLSWNLLDRLASGFYKVVSV